MRGHRLPVRAFAPPPCQKKFKLSRVAGQLWTASWLMIMLSIPYVIYWMFSIKDAPVHEVAFNAARIFTILTTIFSFREIIKHVMHYHQPKLQARPRIFAAASSQSRGPDVSRLGLLTAVRTCAAPHRAHPAHAGHLLLRLHDFDPLH